MSFIKGFGLGMKSFGGLVAVIVNSVLLIFVYFIGVGLTWLVARLSGKRFLEMGRKKGSYWSTLNLKKESMERYYRQF
jgi:hypothetical protein